MITKLKQKYKLLKNDRHLVVIFLLHVLLLGLHFYENYVGNIEYHWYLRAGGCGLIALGIFFFGRKGLAYALLIYSCTLVYINNFYNYATIFFMLIATGANPKLRKVAPWIYLANIFVAYSLKRLGITPFIIHLIYCYLFYTKIEYVFAIHKPESLNLTSDEKMILDELVQGKLQKEIEIFSQQTVTAKLKAARERNLCDSSAELISRYSAESGKKVEISKCGKVCKPNCPKKDKCGKID